MSRAGTALAAVTGATGIAASVFGRTAPWRVYPWYLAGLVPGLVSTELSGPAAAAQAAATGLALRLGAGRSTLGRLGLVAGAGAAVSLAGLHRAGQDASGVLDRALETVAPYTETPVTTLGPVITRDVRYHDEAPAQLLDIWQRPDRPSNCPVMIQVHGGSWTGGSKATQGLHLMRHLTARGWICVSIDYRLGPDHRWPAQIVDVKRAIAWVREHIAEYGGDPSFIAVTGGSAGGHLAGLAAVSGNDPAFQPGFEDADTSVQAGAPVYGVYDLTALNDDGRPRLRRWVRAKLFTADFEDDPATWRAASPTHRVDEHAPPLLIVHGDRDEIVTVNQARGFARRAAAVSGHGVHYAELPYAHHAFDLVRSARTMATVRAVTRFFDAVRSSADRPASRPAAR
jgi:acetyl esterase/lipase